MGIYRCYGKIGNHVMFVVPTTVRPGIAKTLTFKVCSLCYAYAHSIIIKDKGKHQQNASTISF